MFLQNTPKNWAQQVHMYVFRLISQPVSALNVLPQELVSHTRPQFALTIDLNLNLNIINTCISQYCFPLPENSHYDKTDLNLKFSTKHFQNLFHEYFLPLKLLCYNSIQ